MAWKVILTKKAKKDLDKLDNKIASRVREALADIEKLDNPRLLGHALTGPLSDLWSYRIGDYRAVCKIKDNEIIILVVEIEHRSKVYKKRS